MNGNRESITQTTILLKVVLVKSKGKTCCDYGVQPKKKVSAPR